MTRPYTIELERQPRDVALLQTAAPDVPRADALNAPMTVRDAATGEPAIVLAKLRDLGPVRRALLRYPPTTTYRMAGTRNVSRTFGFTPARAAMRRASCRPCSGATDAPAAHAAITAVARDLARALEHAEPEVAHEDTLRASVVRPEWRMHGTQWTSGVVNFTSPMQYHLDANNMATRSAMVVCRRGTEGGHLHVPEYGVAIACDDGDVVFFAGWDLVHGVTPIRRRDPAGYRISAVYYTVAAMRECAEPEEELRRGRARQAHREDTMRERQEEAGLL